MRIKQTIYKCDECAAKLGTAWDFCPWCGTPTTLLVEKIELQELKESELEEVVKKTIIDE